MQEMQQNLETNFVGSYDVDGKEEMVLTLLPHHPLFQNTNPESSVFLPSTELQGELFKPENKRHMAFIPRAYAERLPTAKQIIPYNLLMAIHGDNSYTLFAYARKDTSGEQRLVGKHSLGFGGHISIEDVQSAPYYLEHSISEETDEEILNSVVTFSLYKTMSYAALREVAEETSFLDFKDETQVLSPGNLLDVPFYENGSGGSFKEVLEQGLPEFDNLEQTDEKSDQACLYHLGVFGDNTTPVNSVHICMANVLVVPSGYATEEEFNQNHNTEKPFVKAKEDTLDIYPVGNIDKVEKLIEVGLAEFEPWSITLVDMFKAAIA